MDSTRGCFHSGTSARAQESLDGGSLLTWAEKRNKLQKEEEEEDKWEEERGQMDDGRSPATLTSAGEFHCMFSVFLCI